MKLGDRGAVLVEFAIILPVMMLVTLGMFDVGIMLLQSMQLNFVAQGAAYAEATAIADAAAKPPPASVFIPGSGVSWATSALPPSTGANFAGPSETPDPPQVCVSGTMPVKAIILPLPPLSTTACWPIPTPPA